MANNIKKSSLTLPQKVLLTNLMSVFLGVLSSLLASYLYSLFVQGIRRDFFLIILLILMIIASTVMFQLITGKTDAEIILDSLMDEMKLSAKLKASQKNKKVENHAVVSALNTELENAIKNGDLEKSKSLISMRKELDNE
ncbi:MAG: hypothetical protein CME66_09145 [Halobacteriovoraceae bacterium]|nr:hypothetical protein [Halobacteriovoraceae bacterium]